MYKIRTTNFEGTAEVILDELIENDKDAVLKMCCERAFKMVLSDYDYSTLKDIKLEHIGPSNITEDIIMFHVTAKIEEKVNENDGLLSQEALRWLKSVNYSNRTHEERMALIDAAEILYPNTDDDDDELGKIKRFFDTLNLA